MKRTEIINRLASAVNAETYLEIGVRVHAENFDKINIKHKVGVDPCYEIFDREPTYKLTSDDFFAKNTEKFDIIFIDGLHESKQVERDVNNSLLFLNQGGYIICHDINPIKEYRQFTLDNPKRKFVKKTKDTLWNGDCWKAFVKLRKERDDITMHTVNTDFGCGIISLGRQQLLNVEQENINYQNLDKNRKEWLNLISVDEFCRLFQK
jgi:hypothetical protein